MTRLLTFLICCISLPGALPVKAQETMSLEGKWSVKLDTLDIGVQQKWFNQQFDASIQLPGTLDDAGIGKRTDLSTDSLYKEVLLKLTRKRSYIGLAWYSKEITIPESWKNKDIRLVLERVIWNTRVWVDGKEVGAGESLSVPQRFDLSSSLRPGKHLIAIRIDNRKQFDISHKDMGHAYTDGTQIIWNGVIGKLQLIAKERQHIDHIQTFPNVKEKSVLVNIILRNGGNKTRKGTLQVRVFDNNKREVSSQHVKVSLAAGQTKKELKLDLGSDAKAWDEFNPQLYTVQAELVVSKSHDVATTTFGLREIVSKDNILINGRPLFLRGTLECNIFPVTGYPPMNKQGWLKVFTSAKAYGLNHLRFHSWCPPEAAFEVADSLGFYLQIELPLWSLTVGGNSKTNRFLEDEAVRISKEYGNHPSFCLWSLGNELEGDFSWMQALLEKLKALDSRHLYTTTTFTFQKGHGGWPEPGDQFFISQKTKNGWVRGQGVFNSYPPNFSTDYSTSVEGMTVPLITHEIGQYSVYPNLDEIGKYTGVLDPLNYKAIRKDLQRKGLVELAPAFTLASGKFAANLYKEEIERAMKTKGISGYQLLDLHDFPGQGTALVGILDAFWDSKGLVTPAYHRMYASPLVPLIRFEKAVYTNSERFVASAEVANFTGSTFRDIVPVWIAKDQSGKVVFSGELNPATIAEGNGIKLGKIEIPLNPIKEATELTIELQLKGTEFKNMWKIWVYPSKLSLEDKQIIFTASLDEAMKYLQLGKKVLLNPDTAQIKGVEGRFAPVFWSPVHFPNQPGTMGLLCNPKHRAFAYFPTDFYSDWQWWDLITSSKTMIIDALPNTDPLVRIIDNFYKNRKMATVIEAKVGKGKLILTSLDLSKDLDKRLAARQLRYSLQQYMKTNDFSPSMELTGQQLAELIK
jgi:Glycosyl hydrolases family 2, sugar binding domain/Glycosyl hydrolases family 2/Glycosyl hydrolases family 2, TIM barrel domain